MYYERRKNFYHNRQIPLRDLVSIDQLGQAVLATLVQAPHVSRGEVSRIFQDDIYQVVFNSSNPIDVYHSAIVILRKCEQYLRDNRETQGQVDDFVFHLSMAATVALTRKRQPRAKDLVKVDAPPSDVLLGELISLVREAFGRAVRESGEVLFDKVAKDVRATQMLGEHLGRYLASSRRH